MRGPAVPVVRTVATIPASARLATMDVASKEIATVGLFLCQDQRDCVMRFSTLCCSSKTYISPLSALINARRHSLTKFKCTVCYLVMIIIMILRYAA
jgi:hypothetical protein